MMEAEAHPNGWCFGSPTRYYQPNFRLVRQKIVLLLRYHWCHQTVPKPSGLHTTAFIRIRVNELLLLFREKPTTFLSACKLTMTTTESENEKIPPSWFHYAALGESTTALLSSFILLMISVTVAISIDNQHSPVSHVEIAYKKLGPPPKVDPPRIFEFKKTEARLVTNEMRKAYEKDGVIGNQCFGNAFCWME
jgi:hypothetical protein